MKNQWENIFVLHRTMLFYFIFGWEEKTNEIAENSKSKKERERERQSKEKYLLYFIRKIVKTNISGNLSNDIQSNHWHQMLLWAFMVPFCSILLWNFPIF